MKEKLIEDILENFDFDKVKKTMNFLGWTWAKLQDVPTTYQIMKSARERLEGAYNNAMKNKKDSCLSSGGLRAFAEYNKKSKVVDFLQLDFVLTSWESQIEVDE